MKKKIGSEEVEKEKVWYVISKVLPQDNMIELVYREAEQKTYLAFYDGISVALKEKVEIFSPQKKIFVPYSASYPLIAKRIVLFPSCAEECGYVPGANGRLLKNPNCGLSTTKHSVRFKKSCGRIGHSASATRNQSICSLEAS